MPALIVNYRLRTPRCRSAREAIRVVAHVCLAHSGHGLMSDLIPLCTQKRTWIIGVEQSQLGLILPPASPHKADCPMATPTPRTAEIHDGAAPDADWGCPQYSARTRAEAPANTKRDRG
jgi:hypothetical protein